MTASREMPRYQSIKKVWALKIGAVEINQDGTGRFQPKDEGFGVVDLAADFVTRNLDVIRANDGQGYYVVYDDGYKSYSPVKAFEEGHLPLSGDGWVGNAPMPREPAPAINRPTGVVVDKPSGDLQ